MQTPSIIDSDMPRKTLPQSSKQMEQLNLRVDLDLLEVLKDAHRALLLVAKTSGEDAPNFSKAIRRCMRLGCDVIFNKIGGRPQTESDWAALEATLLARKPH